MAPDNCIKKLGMFVLLVVSACARDEQLVFELPPDMPAMQAPLLDNPPGKGATGGPGSYDFYVKDRRSNAAFGLAAFKKLAADRIAVSTHFVLYRPADSATLMTPAEAASHLSFLEGRYAALRDSYGDGIWPDLQKTGRIVILAYDIEDDYTTGSNSFVSGYFSPRDLYNDAYTSALYTYPPLIAISAPETIAKLGGRSNMLPIVYADLNPFYNGLAYGDGASDAQTRFREMLLHECSHLVTYYARHIARNLPEFSTWLSEGLAEIAPTLLASSFLMQNSRLSEFSNPLVQADFRLPATLIQWEQSGQVNSGILRANLFFNYVRGRLGSQATNFIRALVGKNAGDLAALQSTLSDFGFSDFASFYSEFVLALYVASGGFNLSSYYDANGNAIALDSGSPTVRDSLRFTLAGINNYNSGGVAFQPALNRAPLPSAYATTNCLPPLSFQIYAYYNHLNSESFTPAALGAAPTLRFFTAKNPNTTLGDVMLRAYSPHQALDIEQATISGSDFTNFYHILIVNAGSDTGCLSPGNLPHNPNEGNVTAWIGGNQTGWQITPGANNGNTVNYLLRTGGIATNLNHSGREANYVFVTDYLAHKIARFNLNNGTFAGALGDLHMPSVNSACSLDTPTTNGYKYSGRTYANYCRRSFNAPRGVAVTTAGDILVADTDNHRLLLYDVNGNFIAWLGSSDSDRWQCESTVAHPYCSVGNNRDPVSPYSIANLGTQTNLFYFPRQIAIDESEQYIYIACLGSNRIVRRNLQTGEFAGFVGNGHASWSTHPSASGAAGSATNYFNQPSGIVLSGNYLYVADSNNHRVVRINLLGQVLDLMGGGVQTHWHSNATPEGNAEGQFSYPNNLAIADLPGSDGNTYRYLLVSDAGNHRIARFLLGQFPTGNAAAYSDAAGNLLRGWLGAGYLSWQSGNNTYNYVGMSTSQLFPAEFIYSPQAVHFISHAASGFARDYILTTQTYSARLSRYNANCLWQDAELSTFVKNCGGEP